MISFFFKKISLVASFFFCFSLLSFHSLSSQETQKSPETQPETQKTLPDMPEFQGITQWFNSSPLTKESLKGKVVLVDFWTYTCINCIRTLPHLKEWYRKYKDKGLVIIGVHSAEFEFEKDPKNIQMAIDKYKISYPVANDSKMSTWTAYKNNVWPAHYFIDVNGKIQKVHLGEGSYEESEKLIQELLKEKIKVSGGTRETDIRHPEYREGSPENSGGRFFRYAQNDNKMTGPETRENIDFSQIKSPETYLGFLRRERLVTSGRPLKLNEWNFEGEWRTEGERIVLKEGTGKIRFHFNATKVNLVLHPGSIPVKAVIRMDGQILPSEKSRFKLMRLHLVNLFPVPF